MKTKKKDCKQFEKVCRAPKIKKVPSDGYSDDVGRFFRRKSAAYSD